MTPDEAAALAGRTLAAIATEADETRTGHPVQPHHAADRERVASDLAGLREHDGPVLCSCPEARCDDGRRYAEGLRRTAALYGVTP